MNYPLKLSLLALSEIFFLSALFFLPFSIALIEISLVISFFLWALHKTIHRKAICDKAMLFFLLVVFVGISSVSAFQSGFPLLSARGILKLIKYSLITLLTFDLFREAKQMKRLVVIVFISCIILLADTVYQRFEGVDFIRNHVIFHSEKQVRLTGSFKLYGLLGSYLISVVPVIIGMSIVCTKSEILYRKLLWYIFLGLSLYVLYKSHSRGAWLAFSAAMLLFAIMLQSKWFLTFFVSVFLISPFFLPRDALIHLDKFGQEQTIVERYQLWMRALYVIQARPWFGCGINTYIHNYQKYNKNEGQLIPENYAHLDDADGWGIPGHPAHIPKYYAHSGYLQLAAETGLIALSLFLILLGWALLTGMAAVRRSKGDQKVLIASTLAGYCALLLHALVDTTLHNLQSATLIWFLTGLLFALGRMTQNKNDDTQKKIANCDGATPA